MAKDTQCWFGRWADERCMAEGLYGWTVEAADKAGAVKHSVFRKARWCSAHKHHDDSLLMEEPDEKADPESCPDCPVEPIS